MNKVVKTISLMGIMATIILTNTTKVKAEEIGITTLEDGIYSKTVTLKESEISEYFNSIENTIKIRR